MCFAIVQGKKAMRIAVAKGNVNLVKALLDTTKSLPEQLQAKLCCGSSDLVQETDKVSGIGLVLISFSFPYSIFSGPYLYWIAPYF